MTVMALSTVLSTIAAAAGFGTNARFGVQVFSASGTFTRPSGVLSVTALVIAIGAGGGGAGTCTGAAANSAGSQGGTTSFGALASAAGGSGAVASTTSSTPNTPGTTGFAMGGPQTRLGGILGVGSYTIAGARGGVGFLGIGSGGDSAGAVTVTSNSDLTTSPGGNAGEVAIYFGTVSANETVTIGAGGTPGNSASGVTGTTGQKGQPGGVIVFYWW